MTGPIDLDSTDRGRDWIRQGRLVCAECGRTSNGAARGWRGVLVESDDDPTRDEVSVFCPSCALREFG
jgi:hypothetical protein